MFLYGQANGLLSFWPGKTPKMRYRPSKSTILACILCFISRKQVALAIGSRYFRFFKTKQKVAKTKKNHGKSRGFYGISHVILRSDMKMQRKIAERCIRYFTKIGLSPASTTTLPLLDTKIGCGGRTRISRRFCISWN